MKIINNTSFDVIAFGWHTEHGYGDEIKIKPAQFAYVSGPYIGEMGGKRCYITIKGEITCQEAPDDDNGFQVIPGSPLSLKAGNEGVTVRHFSDVI